MKIFNFENNGKQYILQVTILWQNSMKHYTTQFCHFTHLDSLCKPLPRMKWIFHNSYVTLEFEVEILAFVVKFRVCTTHTVSL